MLFIRPTFINQIAVSLFSDELLVPSQKNKFPGGMIALIGYGSSISDVEQLARTFAPEKKIILHVNEYKLSNEITRQNIYNKDVEARHFNIATVAGAPPFESEISFLPCHTVRGIGFYGQQTIMQRDEYDPYVWVSFQVPYEKVHHSFIMNEKYILRSAAVDEKGLDGAPRVNSMCAAFQQKNWKFGKIKPHQSTSGIADVTLQIHYSSVWNESCTTVSSMGVLIPTGTRRTARHAEFLFAPIVGNNHHWGFILGNRLSFFIKEFDHCRVHCKFSSHNIFLISNIQIRSFDLVGKPWSRYMEVYQTQTDAENAFSLNDQASGSSGINIFTRCVRVHPRWESSNSVSLIFKTFFFNVECGTQLFIRHAERVELNHWREKVALKSILGKGATTVARTINKNFEQSDISNPADFTDALINIQDIDLESMSHPPVLSTLFFTTVGTNTCLCRTIPVFMSIGGIYEWSSRPFAIHRWTLWGKIGCTY